MLDLYITHWSRIIIFKLLSPYAIVLIELYRTVLYSPIFDSTYSTVYELSKFNIGKAPNEELDQFNCKIYTYG